MDIDQKMIDYIFSHTSELHPVQKKIIKFNEKLGYIKKLQISVLQANFIEFLIKFKKFKSCLEIGTFTGYSALSIALSLPKNGRLYCIDKNEEKLNIAKKFFKQARVNKKIFTDSTWYTGYLNSIYYVVLNTIISVAAALPAAYAFSRYKFLGDKHLFFWLLTNRMAPPAVFALPFFQFYSSVNLFDTHVAVALSHCLFNIPLAVWILEGFMSAVPKELDETAYVDGYSFWKFFFKIFIPTITAGIGITMFFCFMFSWVELLLAKTLTAVAAKPIAATMTRTASTSGYELGLLAAAGSLTIVPGAIVIYFVRNYIAKGFALGRV